MTRKLVWGNMDIRYELFQTERRDMEIRVSADAVKAFVPKRTPLRVADEFVLSRWGEVQEHMAKLEAYRRAHEREHPVHEGAPIMLRGKVYRLHYGETSFPGIHGEVFCVSRRPGEEPRAAVRRALMEYADLCYRERLAVLAPMVGREPGGMRVRAQKSRWGSCSSRGDLSLNYKIVMAPPQVMDYILIHELCHLYEMNHSQRFWARLKRHMPDYEEWKKWLQTNGGMLGV